MTTDRNLTDLLNLTQDHMQMTEKSSRETVRHYIDRVSQLARRIKSAIRDSPQGQSTSEGVNQALLDNFILGLPSKMKAYVYAKNPKTLDDAFNQVLQYEKIRDDSPVIWEPRDRYNSPDYHRHRSPHRNYHYDPNQYDRPPPHVTYPQQPRQYDRYPERRYERPSRSISPRAEAMHSLVSTSEHRPRIPTPPPCRSDDDLLNALAKLLSGRFPKPKSPEPSHRDNYNRDPSPNPRYRNSYNLRNNESPQPNPQYRNRTPEPPPRTARSKSPYPDPRLYDPYAPSRSRSPSPGAPLRRTPREPSGAPSSNSYRNLNSEGARQVLNEASAYPSRDPRNVTFANQNPQNPTAWSERHRRL
ncbi:serine/arginine repetitive matrix protein 1-like [Orussus abietinus]|uniref:serine/arginine repetitive matrix protein 1-like n=1 Tax=Orussus abietinus TaxID=222816 RepID=UPI0006250E44|nr:serine/arginine repetitive matrix protein 1-like [Orussus abietinus]